MEYGTYEFTNLPYEQLFNVMLNLDLQSILNFCNANTFTQNICKDEYFWKIKFERDFPFVDPPFKFGNNTPMWRDSYIEVVDTFRPLQVYFDNGDELTISKSMYFTPEYYINVLSPQLNTSYVAIFASKLREDLGMGVNYVYIDGQYYEFSSKLSQPYAIYIIRGSRYDLIKKAYVNSYNVFQSIENGQYDTAINEYLRQAQLGQFLPQNTFQGARALLKREAAIEVNSQTNSVIQSIFEKNSTKNS